MPTVVGIFDSKKHAEDAVLGLVAAGFERFDVKMISDVNALAEQGVEDAEIEICREGMRRGGAVVSVRCYTLGRGKAAEVMRKLGAVDISTRAGAEKAPVQPFAAMTEKASLWGMRAGETEAERRDANTAAPHGERLGEIDRVYGGGMGQKGEETRNPKDKSPKTEDRTARDKISD
jgi:hypothetical protein